MRRAGEPLITVVGVCRSMDIEPERHLMWRVGNAVESIWTAQTGQGPLKLLGGKTGGGGSHCFAHYPVAFRPVIEEVIRSFNAAKANQLDLFT